MKKKLKGLLSIITSIFIISGGFNSSTINKKDALIEASYSAPSKSSPEPTTLNSYEQEINQANAETTSNITTTNPVIEVTSPATESKSIIINPTPNLVVTCSDCNFDISTDLMDKINYTINNFNKNDISFQVYDLETNATINYNLDEKFNGACIVKPSIVLYLLKLAEVGKIDLNQVIPYPGNLVGGSGYLNGYYNGYQAYTGQKITVFEYMYFCLYYSDNNSYRILWKLLIDSGYFENYQEYMKEIDAESLCVSKDSMWVRGATAEAGVNIMKEIFSFSQSSILKYNVDFKQLDGHNLATIPKENNFPGDNTFNKELTFGEIIYWIMADGKYDYIEAETGNFSVTKTGFVSGNGSISCRNLISISYGERTYIICLLTKFNDENARKAVVNDLLSELNQVIIEFDNYLKLENKNGLVKKFN